MLRSQPIEPSLEPVPMLTVAYALWVGSWETALGALATASQSRTLSRREAAAHQAVIAAERKLVTKEFARLLGADPRL